MKNNFNFKILAFSLMTVFGVSTALYAQALPTPELAKALQANKTQPTDLNGVSGQANNTSLPAPSAPVASSAPTNPSVANVPASSSTTSAPASSASVANDSSKSDPDAARFALSSQEAMDKDSDLKDFTKSSENSIYEDDALQSEINLIQKRIQKLGLLTDLKKAQNKLDYIKSGKPVDKEGNPIDQKSDAEKKVDSQVIAKVVLPPPPKSQVVAVYGFGDANSADIITNGYRHTVKTGDSVDGRSVVNITEKGVYVSGGKHEKATLLPVNTDIASSVVGQAVKGAIPAGGGNGFGSYAGGAVTAPTGSPTSFPVQVPDSSSDDLTAPTPAPLNFPPAPAPPQLMPPSPSVSH